MVKTCPHDEHLNQGDSMSKIMNEIIQCIEQDDEFREKYYDNIDRLDEQENATTPPRRIPSIYPVPLPPKAQEKDHA